jgi:hypothetical protein
VQRTTWIRGSYGKTVRFTHPARLETEIGAQAIKSAHDNKLPALMLREGQKRDEICH